MRGKEARLGRKVWMRGKEERLGRQVWMRGKEERLGRKVRMRGKEERKMTFDFNFDLHQATKQHVYTEAVN